MRIENSTQQRQQFPSRNYTPSFRAIERTFGMIKPDAFERKLDKLILEEIKRNDFRIIKSVEGIAPREKLENNYVQHKSKSFFKDWIDFLQSGKTNALVIEGENAIERFRQFALELRKKFAPNEKRRNLIHSSDSPEAAKREIENFFDIQV